MSVCLIFLGLIFQKEVVYASSIQFSLTGNIDDPHRYASFTAYTDKDIYLPGETIKISLKADANQGWWYVKEFFVVNAPLPPYLWRGISTGTPRPWFSESAIVTKTAESVPGTYSLGLWAWSNYYHASGQWISGVQDKSHSLSYTVTSVINGACATTHNNCTTGNSASPSETGTEWQWSCNGIGGGTNAQCTETKPLSPPTNVSVRCTPNMNTGSYWMDVSWYESQGAINYPLRVRYPASANRSDMQIGNGAVDDGAPVGIHASGDPAGKLSYRINGQFLDGQYRFWMHAWNNTGFSAPTSSIGVSCHDARLGTKDGICHPGGYNAGYPESHGCSQGIRSEDPADVMGEYRWTCLGAGNPVGVDSSVCREATPKPIVYFDGAPEGSLYPGNDIEINGPGNVLLSWSVWPNGNPNIVGGHCEGAALDSNNNDPQVAGWGLIPTVKPTSGSNLAGSDTVYVDRDTTFYLRCFDSMGFPSDRRPVGVTVAYCNGNPPTNASFYPGDIAFGDTVFSEINRPGVVCEFSCNAGYGYDSASQTCQPKVLNICSTPCDGNGVTRTNQTFSNASVTLYACYGIGNCSGNGDISVSGLWQATDTPDSAIDLLDNDINRQPATGSSSSVFVVKSTSALGTRDTLRERITFQSSLPLPTVFTTAQVLCDETVNCGVQQAGVCSHNTVSGTSPQELYCHNGSGGTVNLDCNGVSGTRYCDFNWKETTLW